MTTRNCGSLVSIDPSRLLYVGDGPFALSTLAAFQGRRVEVQTTRANETEWVTLGEVTRNRETGDLTVWAIPDAGHGRHIRLVSQR